MKRIVSWLLCALLLLGLCPAAVWAEDGDELTEVSTGAATPISSREDMLLLAADPAGSFELTGDIDMGGEVWTPIAFFGQLNGHGHTLYNLTVNGVGTDVAVTYDDSLAEYETVFAGLFSTLKEAEVRELNLVGTTVFVTSEEHCFIGAIAGYAEHSTIEQCTVETRNRLTLSGVNVGVGGVVGFSWESQFTGCTVNAELVITDTNPDQTSKCDLGGVYAGGSGRIEQTSVRTRGYAEVYGEARLGGLIGMFKKAPNSTYKSAVRYTNADTEISFFEITPVRRALCSPTIADDVHHECEREQMVTSNYARNESNSPVPMRPEACDEPQYTFETVPGDCYTWGYTVHTCAVCGYSYRDDYTPPQHQYEEAVGTPATCTEDGELILTCAVCGDTRTEAIPATGHDYREEITEPTCTEEGLKVSTCANCGDKIEEVIPAAGHTPDEWVVTVEPQVDVPGEEVQLCQVCGVELDRRVIDALPHVYAEQLILSAKELTLTSEQGARLTAALVPEDTTEQTFVFTSSDPTVASVLENGRILAGHRGEAVITCTSGDGRVSDTCTVTVTYTRWQWVKHYVLFGWLFD